MTSVLNHLQLLNGSSKLRNKTLLYGLTLLLGLASCSPKSRVLRSPNYPGANTSQGNTEGDLSDKDNQGAKEDKVVELDASRTIALLLPLKLDVIANNKIEKEDVNRSSLALDFYQGFQMGLNEISSEKNPFKLKVIDSKDDVNFNKQLASSDDVLNSGLFVGPIYPVEIKAFSENLIDKDKLVINPLAASSASEFNQPNLVSITPSIEIHRNSLASKVASDFSNGDVIIVYNTSDDVSEQFLDGISELIKSYNTDVKIVLASSLEEISANLTSYGNNLIVSGTTQRIRINTLIQTLLHKNVEENYSFTLYGHPLWERFDFSIYSNLQQLNIIITSESLLNTLSSSIMNFNKLYKAQYGVNPSDQSYKGYDIAKYFGGLINKYGLENLKSKILEVDFTGIYNTYKFDYNENWGFINGSVSLKEFKNGSFQLL